MAILSTYPNRLPGATPKCLYQFLPGRPSSEMNPASNDASFELTFRTRLMAFLTQCGRRWCSESNKRLARPSLNISDSPSSFSLQPPSFKVRHIRLQRERRQEFLFPHRFKLFNNAFLAESFSFSSCLVALYNLDIAL